MRLISVLLIICVFKTTMSLPFKYQIALLNSLEVGRHQNPMAWLCSGCEESNKPINSTAIENEVAQIRAIISVYDEYTILAFRYINTLKNIWQNLLWVLQRQDDNAPQGCRVQREYDRMWIKIKDHVITKLKECNRTKRLIITGISLGGSLACISYVDIQATNLFDNIEVITFGASQVGNDKWAKWFDSKIQSERIYIRKDPVVHLPRCFTRLCNYKQTGKPIVCYPYNQECKCENKTVEQQLEMKPSQIISELNYHKKEIEEDQFQGFYEHIFGYKKIRDYTLKC